MRAVTYNSDGYSERLVVLDDFNKINEDSPTSTGGGGCHFYSRTAGVI